MSNKYLFYTEENMAIRYNPSKRKWSFSCIAFTLTIVIITWIWLSNIYGNGGFYKRSKHLLSFGVIADIQYCDIPNGWNTLHTFQRYYRQGIIHLKNALRNWQHLPLVLNLGDSLDSKCSKVNKTGHLRRHAMETLEKTFREEYSRGVVHHLVGNNDFENFDRMEFRSSFLFSKTLAKGQKTEVEPVTNPGLDLNCYYSFAPVKGVRIVVLDTMDIAASGWPADTHNAKEGWKILKHFNHNKNLNSDAGLPDKIRRYVMYNGNVSYSQLRWLDNTLTKACGELQEVVIVTGHHPLLLGVSNTLELVWNYQDVLKTLQKHRRRGKGNCPAIYLNGDAHWFRAARDPIGGMLHVTLPGVIQAHPKSIPYTIIDVYSDKIIMRETDIIKQHQVDL